MAESKLVIEGGHPLQGEIRIQGAKNSVLPLLSAVVLCDEDVVLERCPALSDVYAASRILTHLGCRCSFRDGKMEIRNGGISRSEIPEAMMHEMRSSITFLGPLLSRTGSCTLYLPGGCELGPRPIDMHLHALRQMGAEIHETHGMLRLQGRLRGADLHLPFPSVGATENIMLAAVLAQGRTRIHNAAREPEIRDLAEFLAACGAKISGAGTDTVIIDGVERLHGCVYRVMPDRIAAATYLSAAAAAGGSVCIQDCCPEDLTAVTEVLRQMGCRVYCHESRIYLQSSLPLHAAPYIRTMPHPGFPTDAQALLMAAHCKARGSCMFEETIFDSRYRHVDDLIRMGADIRLSGRAAVVHGVQKLSGTTVHATDLRGGAAMLIAGLTAEGVTELTELSHLDRGYEDPEGVLRSLGAKIERIT
ncbi:MULTISPECIES: UDP-N-acetylglucosamine 1-carboxyvinyltransferase [Ruminococcus]|uniref:UDP-N-acetylglucosamine 1-carboxyvinyltransferase n=1 Tax=Ruminococcus TaxID=1263 RepID=UPI0003400CF5|nr:MULTISPECIES: UDP-N-acetylglucosamine 1-carboxyvinyltransferase [Ruminococcus]CDD52652.1 uDP-N-acetylglucosamine 1-carboxyvinyltransferase [Ruminococcus sp. CAG:379]